jgi:hypothetical protein
MIWGKRKREDLDLAASLVARYSKARGKEQVEVFFGETPDAPGGRVTVAPAQDGDLLPWRY